MKNKGFICIREAYAKKVIKKSGNQHKYLILKKNNKTKNKNFISFQLRFIYVIFFLVASSGAFSVHDFCDKTAKPSEHYKKLLKVTKNVECHKNNPLQEKNIQKKYHVLSNRSSSGRSKSAVNPESVRIHDSVALEQFKSILKTKNNLDIDEGNSNTILVSKTQFKNKITEAIQELHCEAATRISKIEIEPVKILKDENSIDEDLLKNTSFIAMQITLENRQKDLSETTTKLDEILKTVEQKEISNGIDIKESEKLKSETSIPKEETDVENAKYTKDKTLVNKLFYPETYIKKYGKEIDNDKKTLNNPNMSPVDHFMTIGAERGYFPLSWFDTQQYKKFFLSDPKNSKNNPLVDFLTQPKGVTDKKREKELIVSLTSFPARMQTAWLSIESLLRQSLKPDRIILWLCSHEFPDKKKIIIPKSMIDRGVEILYCDKNLKGAKKFIPALEKFPEAIYITADDDLFYDRNHVEILYSAYNQDPSRIYARYGRLLKTEEKEVKGKMVKRLLPYVECPLVSKPYLGPDQFFIPGTGAGVIFSSSQVCESILDTEIFEKYALNQDDVWFFAACVKRGTEIRILNPVPLRGITQDIKVPNLWEYNKVGYNDLAIQRIFSYYSIERILDIEPISKCFACEQVLPYLGALKESENSSLANLINIKEWKNKYKIARNESELTLNFIKSDLCLEKITDLDQKIKFSEYTYSDIREFNYLLDGYKLGTVDLTIVPDTFNQYMHMNPNFITRIIRIFLEKTKNFLFIPKFQQKFLEDHVSLLNNETLGLFYENFKKVFYDKVRFY